MTKRASIADGSTSQRELCTVLLTDVVSSTRTAAKLGDGPWREILDRHDAISRAELKRHGGREIKTVGDGFLARFEVPAKAVRCAHAIALAVRDLGIEIRAGIHTGECELRNHDLGGLAIHMTARIVALAQPGEILVSQTVKDLVIGSKLPFRPSGTHTLRGVPGKWRLFALNEPQATIQATRSRSQQQSERGTKTISILVVDDHPLWRRTVRQVIELKKGMTVVGEASDGIAALHLARKTKPDVVLMDMDLPKLNGVEATMQLLSDAPEIRVLFLSASDTRDKVLKAVEVGAAGYLLKTAEPDEIVSAVRRVHAGDAVFAPSLANLVLDEFRRLAGDAPRKRSPLDELTERERDVLKLMAEGRSNAAIGKSLYLSSKTVEAHVASIFAKLRLEPAPDDHRRVLAVVTYLRSA